MPSYIFKWPGGRQRFLLLASTFLVLLLFFSGCPLKHSNRPNVVLIVIDTLRADKLGAYGFPGAVSPELDTLAGAGAIFENVLAQSSWTRPSIASMIASRYPRTLGIYKEKDDSLNSDVPTLATVLHDNGYTTIGATANPTINSPYGFHRGFDLYLDSGIVYEAMRPRANQVVRSDKVTLPPAEKMFDRMVREAKKDKLDKPYYLQMNLMEVHERETMVRPEFRESFREFGAESRYLEAIRQVSLELGRFVNRLSSLPGWEDTLFVLTSDHGEGLTDHPNVKEGHWHGSLLYESQLKVPLILYRRSDQLLKGKVIKDPVRLLDLAPTILEYLDIKIPEGFTGTSLIPLLLGRSVPGLLPEYFVAETNWRDVDKIGVYSKEWKYFENRDNWHGVLPRELQRIGNKENGVRTDEVQSFPDVAARMQQFLQLWENRWVKQPPHRPTAPALAAIEQLKTIGYLR